MAANLIILFAKAPVPGRVKTRLTPPISPGLAAELHSAFVEDMISRFRSLKNSDFELHTDTRIDAWKDTRVTRKLQISGDLGLRMIHSLTAGLNNGYHTVTILGSDAPTLPEGHIEFLMAQDAAIALGPAEDGGFYAITARRVHPAMFEGVAWSRPDTLNRTIDSIHAAGLTVALGPTWHDVDEPADLRRLAGHPSLSRRTAACLARAIEALPNID